MIYFFDLDGTLIDSRERHYLLMKKLLIESDIKIPSQFDCEFMKYKADGYSGKMYLKNIMGLKNEQAEKLQNLWIRQIENEEWLRYDKLYNDSKKTLEKLHEKDVYFLTSRTNEQGLQNQIKKLELDKYVKKCIVVNPKDSKYTKTTILKEYIIKHKDNCMMVGDTEIDYNAAVENNVQYYILNRGFRSKKFWDDMGILSYSDFSFLKV